MDYENMDKMGEKNKTKQPEIRAVCCLGHFCIQAYATLRSPFENSIFNFKIKFLI